MGHVSGLFCAANYSCVRCACVSDLGETDDFDAEQRGLRREPPRGAADSDGERFQAASRGL